MFIFTVWKVSLGNSENAFELLCAHLLVKEIL